MAGVDNLIGTVWGRGYMIREPIDEDIAGAAAMPTVPQSG